MPSHSNRGEFRKHLSSGFRLRDALGEEKIIRALRFEDDEKFACAQTTDGDAIRFPLETLTAVDRGTAALPGSFEKYRIAARNDVVMPVYEERVEVDKRKVELDRGVRVRKQVAERNEHIDMPLMHDEADVTRVPIGKVLDGAAPLPEQRQEGNTFVIPVLEEILVVEKRFRLVEEIRITKRQQQTRLQETIPLRTEKVEIERFGESSSDPPGPAHDRSH